MCHRALHIVAGETEIEPAVGADREILNILIGVEPLVP